MIGVMKSSERSAYADPSGRPATEWSADEHRAFAIHHPHRPPRQVVERYPAHLHLNLLQRLQGRGVGTALFLEWMAHAARQGIAAMHVGVNNANAKAVQFWAKQGFVRLDLGDDAAPRTIWMGRSREQRAPL